MKDWDEAYKKKGIIHSDVASIVKDSVELLHKKKINKILDLCFGTGRHTIFLAENGFDVYGIDISKKGKEITEQKLVEKNLNAQLKIADMRDIPYEDDFFDAIIAIGALQHNTSEGLNKTISELERISKNNAILIAIFLSTKDPRCGAGKELEANTFINIEDPDESDVPHHYLDEENIGKIFKNFKVISLLEKAGFSKRRQQKGVYWELIAEKS